MFISTQASYCRRWAFLCTMFTVIFALAPYRGLDFALA